MKNEYSIRPATRTDGTRITVKGGVPAWCIWVLGPYAHDITVGMAEDRALFASEEAATRYAARLP